MPKGSKLSNNSVTALIHQELANQKHKTNKKNLSQNEEKIPEKISKHQMHKIKKKNLYLKNKEITTQKERQRNSFVDNINAGDIKIRKVVNENNSTVNTIQSSSLEVNSDSKAEQTQQLPINLNTTYINPEFDAMDQRVLQAHMNSILVDEVKTLPSLTNYSIGFSHHSLSLFSLESSIKPKNKNSSNDVNILDIEISELNTTAKPFFPNMNQF